MRAIQLRQLIVVITIVMECQRSKREKKRMETKREKKTTTRVMKKNRLSDKEAISHDTCSANVQ